MASKETIGVIGSGDVGKALASGFARHGYHVTIGSREPGKLDAWSKTAGGKVSPGTFADAARFGQVVVLAIRGDAAESAIDLAGVPSFSGKLVLDVTNPLDFSHGMPPSLFVGTTDSLGERIQRKLPEAKVVKCFNTVGNGQMIDPKFQIGAPLMLICGDDAGAKTRTDALLRELGWPGTLDVGGIDGSRSLEALTVLWVRAGAAMDAWDHAFQVVR